MRSFRIHIGNGIHRGALVSVLIFVLVGICAPFLANHKPLFAKYEGQRFYPVFSNYPQSLQDEFGNLESIDWRKLPLETAIWPPIAYSSSFMDPYNRKFVSPFETQYLDGQEMPLRWRHYLGTDRIGRDTAAGLVYGMRIAVWVAFFSALIAGIVGLVAGGMGGFFAGKKVYIATPTALLLPPLIALWWYYVSTLPKVLHDQTSAIITVASLIGVFLFSFLTQKLCTQTALRRLGKIAFDPDAVIMRLIELINSVPRLLLILSVAAISSKSMTTVILIIGLTGWTEIARIFRGEVLKARNSEYVEASKAIGLRPFEILRKHITPNAIGPAAVAIAFTAAAAILTESALSFLGIGVPEGFVTWGKMMQIGRGNLSAWWLIIPPGLLILWSVFTFQNIARKR